MKKTRKTMIIAFKPLSLIKRVNRSKKRKTLKFKIKFWFIKVKTKSIKLKKFRMQKNTLIRTSLNPFNRVANP